MNFLKLPVQRPVTTVMIFVGVCLLGLICWTRIPQELFPSLEYPQITIVTKYEGAGPEESENLISKLIEETVGTVKNVKRISSISREGTSIVSVEFRWGTNMNLAAMDIREKIDLIKDSLPRDSREPVVLKFNPLQSEAMIISVNYNTGETDPWKMAELRSFCKKNIKDELERLDGVAKVEIRGGEKKEILVEIDKGRLLAQQVSIIDMITALKESNITYPAGIIKEETYEYLVKTVGEFQTIDDIAALSFSKRETGLGKSKPKLRRIRNQEPERDEKIIFMKDIANIKESLRDKTGYSRHNGKENISLGIYPQSGSNLIKISDAVLKKLKDIKDKIPSNVDVKIIYDQSEFVKNSLGNVYSEAIQGAVLCVIILYFFMKSLYASFIINAAIPITILFSLSVMYFTGITLNTMSLGGLAVGVGMVADNANLVFENNITEMQKYPDRDRREVIYESTVSLVPAIISSTLTTIAVFLPFIFVTGTAGQLFKQLALTITFSMIASVFAAILFIPRMSMTINLAKIASVSSKEKMELFFKPYLEKVLKWPWSKMAFFFFLYVAAGLLCFYIIPKEFMPKVDERRFVLNISMHPDTPLEITNALTKRVEALISKYPELKDMSVGIGSTGDELGSAAIESLSQSQSRITVNLKDSGLSTNKIVTEIGEEIKKWDFKDLSTEFITAQGLFGSGIGASAGLTVEIKGKDLGKLRATAERIAEKMNSYPNFYGIRIRPSALVPELRFIIERDRASMFGLSTQDISSMFLAAIKGYVATKLKTKDEEFDIRVRLRPQDRDTIEKVREMTAYSPWGMTIKMKQLGQALFVESNPEIRRSEGERTYSVSANVNGTFGNGVKKLKEILNSLPHQEDVLTTIGGEMLALQESMKSSLFAIILGVIIIFMILASQFESLVQPVIVMTLVPIGLIGAVISLLVCFQSINAISMLGIIMLIGMVVSISIVLVDRYNALHQEKPEEKTEELVVHGTAAHLRPILMTTLTTILGLSPLALGIGQTAGGTSMPAMAIAVIGGLSFGLVLALFFVPYVYLKLKGSQKIS
ncbi:MAG: efflux RND transporter permease subunit [Elusimicrobia bacterium]|nr:efflux RND transporter permease subunit [Elusimicrobiota bacterium]